MHLKSQILVKFSKVCILVHVKVSSQFLGCEIFASCGLRSLLALVIGRSDIRETMFSFSGIIMVTSSAVLVIVSIGLVFELLQPYVLDALWIV